MTKQQLEGEIATGSSQHAWFNIELLDGLLCVGVSHAQDETDFQKSLFSLPSFLEGLGYLFPQTLDEGINPVTFRGTNGINIAIGRLHFGTSGGSGFSPHVQNRKTSFTRRKKWMKEDVDPYPIKKITVVASKGDDDKPSILGAVVLDEAPFLECLRRLLPDGELGDLNA